VKAELIYCTEIVDNIAMSAIGEIKNGTNGSIPGSFNFVESIVIGNKNGFGPIEAKTFSFQHSEDTRRVATRQFLLNVSGIPDYIIPDIADDGCIVEPVIDFNAKIGNFFFKSVSSVVNSDIADGETTTMEVGEFRFVWIKFYIEFSGFNGD